MKLACRAKKILERDRKVSLLHPPLEGMHCWVDENGTMEERFGSIVKRWCNYTALETDSGHPGKVITIEASLHLDEMDSTGCPCYPPCNETEYDVSVNSILNPFKSKPDYWFTRFFEREVGTFIFISSLNHLLPFNYCLR